MYQVITTSNLQQGVEPEQAVQQLGKIFNLSPEKAQKLLEKPRVIKKGLNAEQAKKLRAKLEKAGLEVKVKAMTTSATPRKPPNPVKREQPRVEKNNIEIQTPVMPPIQEQEQSEGSIFGYVSPLSVILCLLVAVLGAVIWAGLAMAFNTEYAIAAIAIAVVIAGASAIGNSHGLIAGVLCALLLVASVMGGKFGAYSYKEHQATVSMKRIARNDFTNRQDILERYSPDMDNKRFAVMIKDYTEGKVDFTNENNETIAELRPELEKAAREFKNLTFEEWYDKNVAAKINAVKKTMGVTAWDLVKRGFDWIDAIIILVGMSLAFKAGFAGKD